jgi:Mrp family chromosome partitioning ATPase
MAEAVGLADILERRARISDAMVYLEALKVHYIPSGRPSGSPADLAQGAPMRELLASLEEFDWIVVDSPPIGAFADALSLATQVDGVIFVARSGLTARHDLEQTLAMLKDRQIVGVVLNGYDKPRKDYYHSYYKLIDK